MKYNNVVLAGETHETTIVTSYRLIRLLIYALTGSNVQRLLYIDTSLI